MDVVVDANGASTLETLLTIVCSDRGSHGLKTWSSISETSAWSHSAFSCGAALLMCNGTNPASKDDILKFSWHKPKSVQS